MKFLQHMSLNHSCLSRMKDELRENYFRETHKQNKRESSSGTGQEISANLWNGKKEWKNIVFKQYHITKRAVVLDLCMAVMWSLAWGHSIYWTAILNIVTYQPTRSLCSDDVGLVVVPRVWKRQHRRETLQLSSSCRVGPSSSLTTLAHVLLDIVKMVYGLPTSGRWSHLGLSHIW